MEVYVLNISSRLIAAVCSISLMASAAPVQTAMADTSSSNNVNAVKAAEPAQRKTDCKVTISVYDKETGKLYEGDGIEFALNGGPDNAGSVLYRVVEDPDGTIRSELEQTVPSCKVWQTTEGNPLTVSDLSYEAGRSGYHIDSVGLLTDCCWWNVDTDMSQTRFDFEDSNEKDVAIYLQRLYYIKNDLKKSEIDAQYDEETVELIQEASNTINVLLNDPAEFRGLSSAGKIHEVLDVLKIMKLQGLISDYSYNSADTTVTVEYVPGMNGVILPVVFGTEDLPEITPYDLNGDGNLTISDAVKLRRYILGSLELSLEEFLAADVNNDGAVNVYDFCLMREELIRRA